MTQSSSRAAWKTAIWSVVLVVFMALFFGWGGPDGFAGDKGRIVAVAILFLIGYASFFVMMGVTRKGGREEPVRDERDDSIEGRAAGITLTVILVYVYMLGISLWAFFQKAGTVPAGWMWFLAYTTVFIGMIAHGALTLLLAAGKAGYGES